MAKPAMRSGTCISWINCASPMALLGELLRQYEVGMFLCSAHPAEFKESVDGILGLDVPLPGPLAKHVALSLLSHNLPAEFARLRAFLIE